MYKNKSFLAIIPARSGSSEIKNKNIKLFKNKPLIYYSIKSALESKIFDNIFLSTNSQKYADIGKTCGAEVPFLRPENISKDTSPAHEYIFHALESFKKNNKKFDYFAILQPTSPLRTFKDIKNSAEILIKENLTSVVSVCESDYPLEYFKKLPEDLNLYDFNNNICNNRQELEKSYRINGAIYICKVDDYLKNKNFYGKSSKAYVMSKYKSIDIDTEIDFAIAEFLYEKISLEN